VLDLWRDDPGGSGSLVLSRKVLGIFFVLLKKHKKSAFPTSKDLLDILSFNLFV